MTSLIIKLVFFLVGGYFCFGQMTPLTHKVDSYLREKNFQGAVMIAKQGKILFSRGYGFANVEHQILNTPQTVFRLGSITKQFTAVAILQLQERGLLNVNDPISKYLPQYSHGDKITIHNLLTHTSGIPSITEFSNLCEIQLHPLTPNQVVALLQDLPLEFVPGTDCKYSDSGYILLGAIIETVSHDTYDKYVQEHIFNPLKMKSSYFDHHQNLIPNRASGYGIDLHGSVVNAEFIDMSFPHAAGSLASTVEDLYLMDLALKEEKLLSHKSMQSLFKIHASSGKNAITYGYGFFIDPVKHSIGHTGSIEGFNAALYRHLDHDITVIILSNQEKTQSLALEQALYSLISHSWRN